MDFSPSLDSHRVRDAGVSRVLWVTLALNCAVAALKIVAGRYFGLVSVYADGLHSFADGLSNVIGLVSLYYASRPPDPDHPYGHRKLEIFAAAGIGVFLLATSLTVGREVYLKVTGDEPPSVPGGEVLIVMAGTFAVNLFVVWYERKRGRELNSPFLLSDSAHTASDLLVTAGVFVSLVMGRMGFAWMDPVAGALVALWILYVGVKIVLENAGYLADEVRVDPAVIEKAALSVPGVLACDGIRSRGTPGMVFVDLSIRVPPAMTVITAHDLSHRVSDEIRAVLKDVQDVTVHIEPAV